MKIYGEYKVNEIKMIKCLSVKSNFRNSNIYANQ